MGSFGPVVLSYGDIVVRQSEWDILTKSDWLNDIIISFFYEHLGERCKEFNKIVKLYDPGLTHFIKMVKDHTEVPILLGGLEGGPALKDIYYAFWVISNSTETMEGESGSHWSLLVFSRPDNQFFHFDSMKGVNYSAADAVFKVAAPHFAVSAKFREVEYCGQQRNSRDCGLHVLANSQNVLNTIMAKLKSGGLARLGSPRVGTASFADAKQMRLDLLTLIDKIKHEQEPEPRCEVKRTECKLQQMSIQD